VSSFGIVPMLPRVFDAPDTSRCRLSPRYAPQQRSTIRAIHAVATVLTVAALASGCGSGHSTTNTTVTVIQQAGSSPAASTGAETTEPTERVVPDVVGRRLDHAESSLGRVGLRWNEVGGGIFGVIDRTAWVVCQQRPHAGSSAGAESRVRLVVDRPGQCTTVSGGDERTVPSVIGLRLDVAESDLDDLGITYQEIGGGVFGVIVSSNWVVCQTQPSAGDKAEKVKLIVDRPGDC